MNVLITGITGQVGSHLADYCLGLGNVTVAGSRRIGTALRNVAHLEGRVDIREADLTDPFATLGLLRELKPERIFHLGAQSSPAASWDGATATLAANVQGTLNVLESARHLQLDTVIVLAGSAAQYGAVSPEEVPIRESQPFRPVSPYGVSKAAAELLGFQYHANYGLRTVMLRLFNQVGPRQHPRYAIQEFSRQIARAEAGLQEPVVKVGNLTARRDFTDVRDGARAFWLAAGKAKPGEVYNLCSQKAPAMQEVLDRLLALAVIPLRVEEDPTRLRVTDEPVLMGDNSRLRADTGWAPEIPFEQTLRDILDAWRERARRGE